MGRGASPARDDGGPGGVAERPRYQVERDVMMTRPNQLWVAAMWTTWRGFVDVAFVVLLDPRGYVPPMEYEEQYHRTTAASRHRGRTHVTESPEKPGRFKVSS